jgi:acyl carrier protein
MEKLHFLNTRNEVAIKIFRIISETLAVSTEELDEQTLIAEDLEADSMDIVALMISIDEEFNIELDINDIPQENTSAGWIIDYVAGKL